MAIKDSCDKILEALYDHGEPILTKEIHDNMNIADAESAANILKREGYIRKLLTAHGSDPNLNRYDITDEGRAFIQEGGYAARRNKDAIMLEIAIDSRRLAKIAIWVSVGCVIVSLVVSILIAKFMAKP